jgi:hypothetical protein
MTHGGLPPGETIRRALAWISDERAARPEASLVRLIEEASVGFDLSPAEEEWLLQLMTVLPLGERPLAR